MSKVISKNIEPEQTETINIVLSVKNEKLFLTDKNNKYVLKFYLVENENLNKIGNECLFININIQNHFIDDDDISQIFPLEKKSSNDFFSINDNNFIEKFNDNNKENDDNKVKNKSNNIKKNADNDILTEEDIKNIYKKLNDEINLETNFKKNYSFIKNKVNEIIKTKNIKKLGNKEKLIEDIYNELILLMLDSSI